MTERRQAAIRKADFSSIYDRPDPRSYYRVLDAYDYQTPAHGQRVFRRLLDARKAADEPAQAVFDLCCSYGMIGALLAYDVTWRDLCDRYHDRALDALVSGELLAADRAWYAQRRLPDAPRVAGLDVAARAVSYGQRAGLLQPGLVENLEQHDPTDALASGVSGVGLVTASGGISYCWVSVRLDADRDEIVLPSGQAQLVVESAAGRPCPRPRTRAAPHR